MARIPTTTVVRRFKPYSNVPKRALLVFAILKELILILHALLRGDLSLEDIHDRVQRAPVSHPPSPDTVADDLASSSAMSEDSSSTCNVSDSTPGPLFSSIRTLCKLIVQRDMASVSSIVEAAPSLVTKRHEGGWYPLHAAVLSGEAEIVKLVLSQTSVDVNAVHKERNASSVASIREVELGTHIEGTDGATAMHYACMIGNLEIIRILIQHGASLNVVDSKNREPVEYFDVQKRLSAVTGFRDLIEEQRKREDFYRECTSIGDVEELIRQNKYDCFERAIRLNPKFTEVHTCYDYNLIHLSVILQRRQFTELLISTNSSVVSQVDARNDWNGDKAHDAFAPPTIPHKYVKKATPLHYACLVHDTDTITRLLQAGADWDVRDWKGRKPEELIYTADASGEHVKSTFLRIREAEEEKRKKREEAEKPEDEPKDYRGTDDPGSNRGSESGEDDAGSMEDRDTDYDNDSDPNSTESNKETDTKTAIQSFLSLESTLGEKLIGQRGPIRSVANAIRLRRSGWVDPDRPLTMLFLGSSGVGKTELAKQLALVINGKDGLATDKGENMSKLEKEYAFVRIDMSEFQERHTVYNLIGSPKSYVGYGEGGALTRPLRKNPKAFVLLDEVEKAHPDVLTLFLQIFDDGRITDSQRGVICCKEATFIMTSNVGSEEIKEKAPELRQLVAVAEEQGRPELYLRVIQEFTRSIRPQLKWALKRDEFIGRINQIAVFLPLDCEDIESVVTGELALWAKRASEKHKITLSWTDEVVRNLATAYDVNYGVRSVANEVQRVAIQLVADAEMKGQILENWNALLTTDENGDIILSACEPKPQPESAET